MPVDLGKMWGHEFSLPKHSQNEQEAYKQPEQSRLLFIKYYIKSTFFQREETSLTFASEVCGTIIKDN